jgi:5-methylcytosine-specific restriction protein A
VREAVRRREIQACAVCGGMEGYFAIHHRRPRAMGGTRRRDTNDMPNLVYIHDGCHRVIESQRALAAANGWLVKQTDDPATIPFLYRGRWVLLTAMGAVENVAGPTSDQAGPATSRAAS